MESLRIPARDGYLLAADLYTPEGPPRAAVLLAPAMAVPRRFYAKFAEFLTTHGLVVLVPDYRGIGGSAPAKLRGFPARLEDWGRLDLAGCLDALAARHPGLPRRWIGHSVGGQLFGLLEETGVDRALFVASQSGYWRHWDGMPRAGMNALWHLLIPTIVPVVGFLPMKAAGQGLDVPPGVARQWARWGRHPKYARSVASTHANFHTFDGQLRLYGFTDDDYAPPAAVRGLAALYDRARATPMIIAPQDLGVPMIGHFAPFKESFRDRLWGELATWIAE